MKYKIKAGHKGDQFFVVIDNKNTASQAGNPYSIIKVFYSMNKAEEHADHLNYEREFVNRKLSAKTLKA